MHLKALPRDFPDTRLVREGRNLYKVKIECSDPSLNLDPSTSTNLTDKDFHHVLKAVFKLRHQSTVIKLATEHFLIDCTQKPWSTGRKLKFMKDETILVAYPFCLTITLRRRPSRGVGSEADDCEGAPSQQRKVPAASVSRPPSGGQQAPQSAADRATGASATNQRPVGRPRGRPRRQRHSSSESAAEASQRCVSPVKRSVGRLRRQQHSESAAEASQRRVSPVKRSVGRLRRQQHSESATEASQRCVSPVKRPVGRPRGRLRRQQHSESAAEASQRCVSPVKRPVGRPRGRLRRQQHSSSESAAEVVENASVDSSPRRRVRQNAAPESPAKLVIGSAQSESTDMAGSGAAVAGRGSAPGEGPETRRSPRMARAAEAGGGRRGDTPLVSVRPRVQPPGPAHKRRSTDDVPCSPASKRPLQAQVNERDRMLIQQEDMAEEMKLQSLAGPSTPLEEQAQSPTQGMDAEPLAQRSLLGRALDTFISPVKRLLPQREEVNPTPTTPAPATIRLNPGHAVPLLARVSMNLTQRVPTPKKLRVNPGQTA